MLTTETLSLISSLNQFLLADGTRPLTGDWELGNFSLTAKAITLNNDPTDGGAVYFDDSATSFLKSSTTGLSLNVGGFLNFSPAVTAVAELGNATYSWKYLYLDADPTDGGAVYFNAGSTSYLKSANDGYTLYVGGFTSVVPFTTAVTDLGTTSKNWQRLWLDNGVTDGGAIYFGAGTTNFLKGTATGTTLEIGGFTSFAPNINNIPDLGTTALRWKDFYLQGNIDEIGTITTGGVVTAGLVDGVDVSTLPALIFGAPLSIHDEKDNADWGADDAIPEHVFHEVEAVGGYAYLTLDSVYFLPDAALTANNTNYATITVYTRNSTGGGQTAVASITTEITGSGDWTAFDAVPLTVTGYGDTDDVFTWEITKTAAGVEVPSGTLFVHAHYSTTHI